MTKVVKFHIKRSIYTVKSKEEYFQNNVTCVLMFCYKCLMSPKLNTQINCCARQLNKNYAKRPEGELIVRPQ